MRPSPPSIPVRARVGWRPVPDPSLRGLRGVSFFDPLSGALGQLAEERGHSSRARDPLLDDQVQALEQRTRCVDIVVQRHFERVDGVVTHDSHGVERLRDLRRQSRCDEFSDLLVEVAISFHEIRAGPRAVVTLTGDSGVERQQRGEHAGEEEDVTHLLVRLAELADK